MTEKDSLSWTAMQLARLKRLTTEQVHALSEYENYLFAYHRPLFCPRCGAAMHNTMAEIDTTKDEGGFDCYCKFCEWSGDIYPDELVDLTERTLDWIEGQK